jgi:hypothetical protein
MKKKTKVLSLVAVGLLVVLGVSLYASGGSLQGRFGLSPNIIRGGVAISVSASTPASGDVAAGTTVEVAKYDITATQQDFVIDTLTIDNKNLDTDNNISAINLSYSNGSSIVTSNGYLVSGVATFSGLSIYVPKDSTTTLDISVDLNTPFPGSATPGETIQLYVDSAGFKAVGQKNSLIVTKYTGTNIQNTGTMTVIK